MCGKGSSEIPHRRISDPVFLPQAGEEVTEEVGEGLVVPLLCKASPPLPAKGRKGNGPGFSPAQHTGSVEASLRGVSLLPGLTCHLTAGSMWPPAPWA